jgi:uncharacterized membrane protein YkoI
MQADYWRLWPSRWPPWLRSLLCAAIVLGAACAKADAQAPQVRPEPELSREQAMALVQKRYGARVVRADFADQDGRHVYVFRLLSADGRVWIVRVDARRGTEVP